MWNAFGMAELLHTYDFSTKVQKMSIFFHVRFTENFTKQKLITDTTLVNKFSFSWLGTYGYPWVPITQSP